MFSSRSNTFWYSFKCAVNKRDFFFQKGTLKQLIFLFPNTLKCLLTTGELNINLMLGMHCLSTTTYFSIDVVGVQLLPSLEMLTFTFCGFGRKGEKGQQHRGAPLRSHSKGFGLTMTLSPRFCKQATTTTNHRALGVKAQQTEGDMCHTLPYLVYYSGIQRASGLGFENEGQRGLAAVSQMAGLSVWQ